jgi:type IV secretory pathway VirB10-like protein
MSSITTDQEFLDSAPSLPEPHFDEEATVLSARPVVPLEEVEARKSRVSFPRPWILGAALIGALLVGISASAIYYSGAKEEPKLSQDMELTAGVDGRSEETPGGFSGPASSQPQAEVAKPVEAKKSTPVISQPDRASAGPDKKPQARLVAVVREKKSNNHTDEETDEDRKAARRQARKDRRRTEREGRNRRSSDELFRIRDIFEGAPRPRN